MHFHVQRFIELWVLNAVNQCRPVGNLLGYINKRLACVTTRSIISWLFRGGVLKFTFRILGEKPLAKWEKCPTKIAHFIIASTRPTKLRTLHSAHQIFLKDIAQIWNGWFPVSSPFRSSFQWVLPSNPTPLTNISFDVPKYILLTPLFTYWLCYDLWLLWDWFLRFWYKSLWFWFDQVLVTLTWGGLWSPLEQSCPADTLE